MSLQPRSRMSSRMIAEWLQLSTYSGVGPQALDARAPSWKGRQERETLVPFVKTGSEKTIVVRAVQEGKSILNVIPSSVVFPPEGGERTITVSTNAESLNVVLSSATQTFPKGEILTMKIMDTVIDVNGTGLNYGVPGDPGADGLYQVVFTIKMPTNESRESVVEKFVINTETINITQPATNVPYIDVDKELVKVPNGDYTTEVNIQSNTKYTIRVRDCKNGGIVNEIKVNPSVVELNSDGDKEYFNIETSRQDMSWIITPKL